MLTTLAFRNPCIPYAASLPEGGCPSGLKGGECCEYCQ